MWESNYLTCERSLQCGVWQQCRLTESGATAETTEEPAALHLRRVSRHIHPPVVGPSRTLVGYFDAMGLHNSSDSATWAVAAVDDRGQRCHHCEGRQLGRGYCYTPTYIIIFGVKVEFFKLSICKMGADNVPFPTLDISYAFPCKRPSAQTSPHHAISKSYQFPTDYAS